MKNRIYLKSTLRQPLRSILLLLLIGLLSAAFTVRVVEYVLIQRETGRLGDYYRAIGTLQSANSEEYNDVAGADLIAKSKYVGLEDRRRCCSGVLQGMYNGDTHGEMSDGYEKSEYDVGVHNSDVFVYGKLLSTPALFKIGGWATGEEHEAYQFKFQVDQVEAGYPENVSEGKTVTLYWITDGKDISSILEELHVGDRYFLKAFYDARTTNMLQWDTPSENLIVKPLNDSGLWFLPVEPGESVNLESPELDGLREELELLRENLSAMLVVGTKDMSAMPNVQQVSKTYYLAEGRWLDRNDDRNTRKVCVVHQEFANFRGLSVGDTITLTLRNLEPANLGEEGCYGYILDGEKWENWRDFSTQTETFEIVGLYGMISRNYGGELTCHNTVMYIPDSCMPEGFGADPETMVWAYSFVLKSSQDEAAFLEENREALEELGYSVSFVENHSENFWASVTPMRQSATFSAVVFAGVLLLGLVLAAFLYLLLRRRDFAILRAMGVPNGPAARGLLGPVALLGLLGIAAGSIPAWGYAMRKTAETLATISGPEGVEVSVELSRLYLVGICACVWALLVAFVAIGAGRLSRRPALELLQGAAGGRKKRKKTSQKPRQLEEKPGKVSQPGKARLVENVPTWQVQTDALKGLPRGRGPGMGVSGWYVLRQIRRAPLKSALAMALALGFVVALGWMDLTAERSQAEADRLYETTVVEAKITQSNPSMSVGTSNIINKSTVDAILETGLVQDVYLESQLGYSCVAPFAADNVDMVYDESRMIRNVTYYGLNQPEAYCARNGIEITYAPGWDNGIFAEEWSPDNVHKKRLPVVLSANMFAQLGLEFGDEVYIYAECDQTKEGNGGSSIGKYLVVGQYTGQASMEGDPVLLGLSALLAAEERLALEPAYSVAEFVLDPVKNRELSARREELKELVAQPNAGALDLTLVLWDEELTQVVGPLEQNVRLMSVLYPVTAALSVLIAIGVSVLLLFQSAREMAALRAMGCTRRRVTGMFSCQQGLLCLLGILLGLVALGALRGGMEGVWKGKTLLCAGLYFLGATIGAMVTSTGLGRRKPMELLQIKE
mgnify:FL=1